MVVRSVRAHLREGEENIPLVLLHLITWFPCTMVTWLVTQRIMDKLRETNTTARSKLWVRVTRRPRTRDRTEMLSVEMGLLVTISSGLGVNVCVTVMCRCRFLENLRGHPCTREGSSFIPLTSLVILLSARVKASPWWSRNVLPNAVHIAKWGPREVQGLRKITRKLGWCPSILDVERVANLLFLRKTWFLAGPRSSTIAWDNADPL